MKKLVLIAICFGFLNNSVRACSLCDPSNSKLKTFRQEAREAKFVIVGSLTNARLIGEQGFTDLTVEKIVKNDPSIGKNKSFTLPRWSLIDPKKPPKYMVFFDVYEGKFDPFRGVPLKGEKTADYVRDAISLDDRDRVKSLLYFFQHLDSPDPDVAQDAFLEFAKASDRDIAEVGPKLDPIKLRKLFHDQKVAPEKAGLFAFLLGACGGKKEEILLFDWLKTGSDKDSSTFSGVLSGLIELNSKEGWEVAIRILRDAKRPFNDKLAVLGTIRFMQASKPALYRKQIIAGMSAVIEQGDMADMAIEDMRRWQWWDQTRLILDQYEKKTHSSPLIRNAIVRYALSCPDSSSAAFIKSVRDRNPEIVNDIADAIKFELDSKLPPKMKK